MVTVSSAMQRQSRRQSVSLSAAASLLLLLLLVAGGCTAQSKAKEEKPKLQTPWSEPPERAKGGLAFDPCAARLHDLCNPLLMHFALYRRMPAGLDELQKIAGPDPSIVFECPASRRTYGYNAGGLVAPGVKGRIVLYDATPAHDGKRFAVVIEETKPGQPLIPQVVALPESVFPKSRPLPVTQPTIPEQPE